MNALSLANRFPAALANGHLPEMDRLLDSVFTSTSWPQLQVDENDSEFRVLVDLPGVDVQDVDLAFSEGALTLKAQRETSRQEARFSARWSGSFERAIEIGPDVDADRITASLKNGVLTVTLPKKPEHRPKRIQIE